MRFVETSALANRAAKNYQQNTKVRISFILSAFGQVADSLNRYAYLYMDVMRMKDGENSCLSARY